MANIDIIHEARTLASDLREYHLRRGDETCRKSLEKRFSEDTANLQVPQFALFVQIAFDPIVVALAMRDWFAHINAFRDTEATRNHAWKAGISVMGGTLDRVADTETVNARDIASFLVASFAACIQHAAAPNELKNIDVHVRELGRRILKSALDRT